MFSVISKNEISIIWRHNITHSILQVQILNDAILQHLCILTKAERNQAKWGLRRLIVCWLISRPDCWTLVCDSIYNLPDTHTSDRSWSILILMKTYYFRYMTSTWKPVSQVCFTFILAIGTSGKCFKGRCDRLIQRAPQRRAFLAQWSPMSLTVWDI